MAATPRSQQRVDDDARSEAEKNLTGTALHEDEEEQDQGFRDRSPDDEEIDEALEETFPASDPPSYSKGLPRTG